MLDKDKYTNCSTNNKINIIIQVYILFVLQLCIFYIIHNLCDGST